MTKFIERNTDQKRSIKPVLSIAHLEQINIESFPKKILSTCHLQRMSITGKQKLLSYRCFQPIEVLPESRCEDEFLFTSYIDGHSHTTIFACSFCYDDTYKSVPTLRNHIYTAHRSEIFERLKKFQIVYPRNEVMSFWTFPAFLIWVSSSIISKEVFSLVQWMILYYIRH